MVKTRVDCENNCENLPDGKAKIANHEQEKTGDDCVDSVIVATAANVTEMKRPPGKESSPHTWTAEESLQMICKGMTLHKIRAPYKLYLRTFKMNVDAMRLTYWPSRKKSKYDGRGRNSYDIFEIIDVKSGWKTNAFNAIEQKFRTTPDANERYSDLRPDHCFSLIFGGDSKPLDLICHGDKALAWVKGLQHLVATCRTMRQKDKFEGWLKEQFTCADTDSDGHLTFEECLRVLNQLNVAMDRKDARALFDAANFRSTDDVLEYDEFVVFYNSLTHRPHLQKLFDKYALKNSNVMGPDELMRFMTVEQKKEFTVADSELYLERFPPEDPSLQGFMTIREFEQLLQSDYFSLFDPDVKGETDDMTQPLSHYFIATSHNTYLVSDQLIGESRVSAYTKTLLRGCRCVELDVWDGPDEEPIIYHGYTLTSKILLRDVLDAIKLDAFTVSKYPVILSIENHCSLKQQDVMAEMFKSILGDLLYNTPINADEAQLPSPQALMGKILIKNKKIEEGQEFADATEILDDRAPHLENGSDEVPANGHPKLIHSLSLSGKKAKPIQLSRLLSDVVHYCKATTFHSFLESKKWKFYEMASFSEGKVADLSASHPVEFVEHNQTYMSRIYPRGTRTDSSNYDPISSWSLGCQLVALNYQTWDLHSHINNAKFQANGNCGYVLKPEYMRTPSSGYHPHAIDAKKFKETIVTVTVISGQRLPKPNMAMEGEVIDPYVQLKIYGHKGDVDANPMYQTKHIENNGFNPIWNEAHTFRVRHPELDFLSFCVWDNNLTTDELIGVRVLPLTCVATGYRHVHIHTLTDSEFFASCLFIHLDIKHPN